MRDDSFRSSWPLPIASACFGITAAHLTYRLIAGRAEYTQFTVGAIAWRGASKTPDYLLLAALLIATIATWVTLRWMAHGIGRLHGSSAAERFVGLIAYCTLPALAWLGANLGGPARPLHAVHLSSAAIAVSVLAAAITSRRSRETSHLAMAGLSPALMAALLGALFLPMLLLAFNRIAFIAQAGPVWQGRPRLIWLAGAGAIAAASLALALVRRPTQRGTIDLLASLQVPLAWAFLIVLPMPWIDSAERRIVFPLERLPLAAVVLVAAAYGDLIWRWSSSRERATEDWTRAVSPLCLAAVILTWQLSVPPAASLSSDDFHFGEWVLPWWTWASEGMLPFRDYVPARGLVNYTSGAVAAAFGDSSAAFIAASTPLVMAVWLVLALVATAAVVGTLPAAAMFALLPLADRITDIDLAMTTLLMIAWLLFFRATPTRWVTGWLVAAVAAFLFAPGQALLMALATAPLLVWQVARGALIEPKRCFRGGLVALAVFAVVAAATPFGGMLLGAWRYVVEHGELASAAWAVEWASSFASPTANQWLVEAVRTSFIAVPIITIALLAGMVAERDWPRAGRFAVVAVPVLLLGLLYIPRAAGRIDPGFLSRLGLASMWMHTALLPVVLFSAWGSRRWPTILAIATLIMAALSSSWGGYNENAILSRALPADGVPATLVEGKAFKLPSLGLASVDAAHLGRLERIRRVLDEILKPGETYLDLTNRNAHYFYFGRRPPIESGAIYNLPHEAQEIRSIERLEKAPVPVVLARADSFFFDGGPPSLRGHAFYRYVVQRYTPVRIEGYIFMIRPDRLAGQNGVKREAPAGSDAMPLLDEAFAPPPLEMLPASWGASWESLRHAAAFVTSVDIGSPTPSSLQSSIRGRDAGLLLLELSCAPGTSRELTVSWDSDAGRASVRFRSAPRVVVPVDASPRWLLARDITALQLTSPDAPCGHASIRRAELWQRRIAAVTDARSRDME